MMNKNKKANGKTRGKSKGKKKVLKIVIPILGVAVIGGAAFGVYEYKSQEKAKDVSAKVVNTASVQTMDLNQSISATGTLESSKSKTVSVDVNDVTIKEVKVSVGDEVKKGDTLVEFDKSDLKEALSEAEEELADVKEDAADDLNDASEKISDAKESYSETVEENADSVEDAKEELEEAKEKVSELKKKKKKASDQEKESIKSELKEAKEKKEQAKEAYENALKNQKSSNKQSSSSVEEAEDNYDNVVENNEKLIEEAEERVEEAEEALESCEAKATMSGVITSLGVEKGDTYSGGEIATIEKTDSFVITTSVDEYDISDVKVGQEVVILTEATDEDELKGEITFVAPSTDSTSSVSSSDGSGMSSSSSSSSSSGYEVKIKVTDKDDRLKLGMTAKCSIILESAKDVLAVPYDAVENSPEGSYVTVVNDDETQEQVSVTVGMESDYYVEISGDDIEEGMKVLIPSDEISTSDSSDDESGMFSFGGMGGGGEMPSGGSDSGHGPGGNGGGPGGNGGGPGGN